MTITVSISEFRSNISDYLREAQSGRNIIIKDEKKGDEIAQLIGKKKFDPVVFRRALRRLAGSISAKDHPEWSTPKKIDRWLRKTRKNAERHF